MDSPAQSSTPPPVLRRIGRYELRQLLGKSAATMTWLVFDPHTSRESMLTLPREQPLDGLAQERWMARVRKAALLDHPCLARLDEIGLQEQWPFVVVDRAAGVTLGEWLTANPVGTPADVVDLMIQALQGMAFAHDAGVAHLDVQLHTLIVNEHGRARWMALAVAGESYQLRQPVEIDALALTRNRTELSDLQVQRRNAERDLLGCGLLLHRWLAGQPALDEPDLARAVARLAPYGHETVRLPWGTPLPVHDALRAIVNRSTATQERHRFHSARTFYRALEGWRQAQALESGGPLALLLDRLHSVGHLPALPGLAGRVSLMTSLEGQHADEIAEQVLQDMALSLELLRQVNSAQMRSSVMDGNGPVLAIRRSIALLGVDGVRRAANALRMWPGPLRADEAGVLRQLIGQVRLAGFAGQALRPAGYDPEVVYLIVVLQNLGRLLVHYHFPEETEQIHELMQPSPPPDSEPGTADLPGMSEEAAANAVLGVDFDTLRDAVARHWGLGDEVLQMIRRLPSTKAVRMPGNDAEMLRATASAANELSEAVRLKPAPRAAAAVAEVASRYARVLKITGRDVRDALRGARVALRTGAPVTVSAPVYAPDDAAPPGGAGIDADAVPQAVGGE